MPLPTASEIEDATEHLFQVQTTRGTFTVRMNPDAPMAAVTFMKLVEAGRYNGTSLNGIWPSYFVGSFGDSTNGANAGYNLTTFRDELVTPFEHQEGALAFTQTADNSADSYDGTFLIDQGYRFYDAKMINLQTTFGWVIEGMEVVNRLQAFDRIISIRKF